MKLTDSAAAKRCLWIAGTLFLLWVGNATLSNKAYLNPYFYDILIRVGITIILAVSLNLINGFTGQFSLGHAGFMAMGGYAAGAFTYYLEVGWLGVAPLPAWAAQPVLFGAALCFGALVAALAGLLVGIPLLRLRGDYLAIATLGMGEIVRVVILNLEFVGGAKGLSGVPAFTNFFWVFLAAIGTAVVIRNMVRSAHGRALISIREDEVAAEAMGIATTWYKVAAFVIGAAWAGVAGGLHGHFVQGLYPNDFTFLQSIEIVVIVVLGGMGSITGSVAAAALLKILENALRSLAGAAVVFYLFIAADAVLSYRKYRGRQWVWGLKTAGYLVALTLVLGFAHEELNAKIAFLRGVLYAVLLILLMLTRPQGLFGKSEISVKSLRRIFGGNPQ